MATTLDHRGWTAAKHLAPCVLCHTLAILRSSKGRPCHWTCAVAWVAEHQDHDHERQRHDRPVAHGH
jgi:hypothetical protein